MLCTESAQVRFLTQPVDLSPLQRLWTRFDQSEIELDLAQRLTIPSSMESD